MEKTLEPAMQVKPIEFGENLTIRYLDEKTLITGQSRTLLKEGNFILDSETINIIAGPGIKISSKGKDTLIISCDLTKLEAKMYDLQQATDKRLETIEKIFSIPRPHGRIFGPAALIFSGSWFWFRSNISKSRRRKLYPIFGSWSYLYGRAFHGCVFGN